MFIYNRLNGSMGNEVVPEGLWKTLHLHVRISLFDTRTEPYARISATAYNILETTNVVDAKVSIEEALRFMKAIGVERKGNRYEYHSIDIYPEGNGMVERMLGNSKQPCAPPGEARTS